MIETSTLVILGAGASVPYGYPTGLKLKNSIIENLNYMETNEEGWIYDLGYDPDELVSTFSSGLDLSRKYSIDSYLAYRDDNDFTELGKIAIVDAISSCESSSKLYNDHNDDDWYTYLTNQLYDCNYEEISDNNLGIITFNYDRSLEMFLFTTLMGCYSIRPLKELNSHLVNSIPIIHMYGRLDPLAWESSKCKRDYGTPCSSKDLKEISENIKLIPEIKDDKIIENANKLIEEAKKIYFLGLDLTNEQNLKLFDLSLFKEKEVFGTAYGLKNGEILNIKKFFNENAEVTINLGENMKSLETIKNLSTFV